MNVIILDYQENFITYLNNDLLDITEHYSIGGIRHIDVEYYMQDISDAKQLFRLGNKIWVQGDDNLTDCLYVINTEVQRDYFKENNVKFTAEDCIVELNYVPFFSQTDLTAKNGFTLSSNAGEQNVKVDWKALDFWFGDYFTIGIVQNTLNTDISKISPKGTMTKMELLRYIEEETCNVFIPRYEKDTETNVIHRFLDYLNPNSSDNNWSITWKWTPHIALTPESNPIGKYDDVVDEDDIVNFPEYTEPITHNPSDIVFRIKDKNGNPIDGLTWNGETDVGMDDNSDLIEVTISYNKPVISASVRNLTSTASSPALPDREIDTSTNDYISISAGDYTHDETLFDNVAAGGDLDDNVVLENGSIFEIYDTETETLLYRHTLNPICGNVHSDILDLAYNVENIEYTVNEEDTFTAISPKLTLDEGNTNALTYEDYSTVITNWVNLAVNKGDKIPMIIERMTVEAEPTDNYMAQSTVYDNYYARPLKPNDDATNDKYEYWKATAYWNAPFTKVAGEMFIEDRDITGVEYNHIITRPDTPGLYGITGTPKMGIVETSDENKYAIYNDVAMKLKDKRFPSVDIDVDVANYKNGKYNDYNIYDKVYVKIPGFDGLVTAIVSETNKKAHDIGENNVKLTNFSIGTKVATKETMLIGDNVSLKYPKKGSLSVTLKDISGVSDTVLANKLINLVLYKADDNGNFNYRGTYTKTTNTNGIATLAINLNPGTYQVEATFPGDIEYSQTTTTYSVVVSGTLETTKDNSTDLTKTTTSTTTKTRYYDKYGRSPDKKYIRAIGRASASGELAKYGYKFYTVEFVRKCPHCGSTELYWGIFWAGNETSNWGKFPATGKREGGNAEGHIFCKSCDADWSIFGKDHGKKGRTKNLTVHKKAEKSSKTDAYSLKKGKLKYDTIKITTKSTNNSKQTTTHTTVGTVDKKVKEWALKKVGSSTGAAAAKKLAQAVGALPYSSYKNFKRKPSVVINKGGNCCDQARLFLMACDAVGVSTEYTLKYVYVCCNHTSYPGCGHVFARLEHKTNGKGTYVDPTHKPWWNTHLTGWGSTPGRTKNYPKSPI